MTLFYYYGRDVQGNPISGDIDLISEREVLTYLSQNGITPVNIEQRKSNTLTSFFISIKNNKISDEQLILLSRQMYTIYHTGLPINKGLDGLTNSLNNVPLKTVLVDISKKLKAGLSFSKAMTFHPKVFNDFFIGMVVIGEATGKPIQAFKQIGDYLERDLAIKKNIQSAIRYPCFVLLSIFSALIAINFLVVPAFNQLFDRVGTSLPWATQLLLWTSEFFSQYIVLLSLILLLGILAFYFYRKTHSGRLRIDQLYYRLPFLGQIFYRASISRYAHSLSALLSANVALNKAIELAAEVVNNHYIRKEIMVIKSNIERGESIYGAHHKSHIFSPLVLQMVYLGEETASLAQLLDEVAKSYEREIDYDIKRLSATIEPLLILILAIFVGLLALGVFLPMWSLFENTL